MTRTAVVSIDRTNHAMLYAQLYVNGAHIGYVKVEDAHMVVILDALEASKFTIIRT